MNVQHPTWQFKRAVIRKPGRSVVNGLRSVDHGAPDFSLLRKQHDDYAKALRTAGADIVVLEPQEDLPDALFVEDTALCLPRGVILMRPGAPSRMGEIDAISDYLTPLFKRVSKIGGPGTIEAGDILTTPREVLVGQSARTNAQGIAELARILMEWGYKMREVPVPKDVLHFKTDCSLLDSKTILSTKRLAATGVFDPYDVIYTASGEEAAANAIRYNDYVIMPEGFPKTTARLKERGYTVICVGNSECAKLDGGMSCLSLRF